MSPLFTNLGATLGRSLGPRARKALRYLGLAALGLVSFVLAFQLTFPFSRVTSVSTVPGGISSAVTIHGPNAPVCAKFLPAVHCTVLRWKSRTEPSL